MNHCTIICHHRISLASDVPSKSPILSANSRGRKIRLDPSPSWEGFARVLAGGGYNLSSNHFIWEFLVILLESEKD